MRNGHILTLDPDRTVYRPGAVAISGTRIRAVGPQADILGAFEADRVIDAQDAVVHPGFIDSHFHISQHTSRGIDALLARNPGTTVNFASWKAALNDKDEYASTALAALDLLRHGYTAFVEGGTALNPEAVGRAAQAVGIRGWLTDPYVWDRSDVMESVPRLLSPALAAKAPFDLDRCFREMGSQLHWNRDADSLLHGYVFLYGLGTASDELQRAAKALADRNNVVVGQHHGYVREMTVLEEARPGVPSLVHLANLGVLGRNCAFVHVNVLRDAEVAPLAASGAAVVWCPANYLFFAARDGNGPIPELHRRGVTIALAVDATKNCTVGDTTTLALHAAAQCGLVLSGKTLLEMLTINAAKTMNADEIGSLERGKRADLVIRTNAAPDAQPGLDPIFQTAVLGRSTSVQTVVVNGRIVFEGGQSTQVEEDHIYRQVRSSMDDLTARLGLR